MPKRNKLQLRLFVGWPLALESLGGIDPLAFSSIFTVSILIYFKGYCLQDRSQKRPHTSSEAISSSWHNHTLGNIFLLALMEYAKIYKAWSTRKQTHVWAKIPVIHRYRVSIILMQKPGLSPLLPPPEAISSAHTNTHIHTRIFSSFFLKYHFQIFALDSVFHEDTHDWFTMSVTLLESSFTQSFLTGCQLTSFEPCHNTPSSRAFQEVHNEERENYHEPLTIWRAGIWNSRSLHLLPSS